MSPDADGISLPLIALLAASALFLLLSATMAFLLVDRFGTRARLRGRVAAIAGGGMATETRDARSPLKRTKQIRNKLEENSQSSSGKVKRRVELRLRIERAGVAMDLRTFYILSFISGAAGSGLFLLAGYPPIFLLAVVPVMSIGLPRFLLSHLAAKRQKAFTTHFADAIDIIVRGIRSGLPVGECLNIIARESPEPVKSEFHELVEGQRLGMTMKKALERACRRMPTADMKFFAVVLNLQQQTGGNLAETLANLSGILRARKKMGDKIKAMSSEARMTATIIGSMPFLISLMIYAISPEYISLLWTDPLGKKIFYGGLLWMSTGVFIMKQMISFQI
jgi:tight adherence protein B